MTSYIYFLKVLILPYILAKFEVNWITEADFRQVWFTAPQKSPPKLTSLIFAWTYFRGWQTFRIFV